MATVLKISSDRRFASSLQYIKRRLVAVKNTSCSLGEEKNRTVLTVENYNPSTVIDALADVVVTDCKAHYIQSRLRLPIEGEINRAAFIKALSTFDLETDKIIAKSLIRLTPNFLIDSFYEFMTDDLKVRWQEVCILANENICYLICGHTFAELLRFLISNIESLSDEAHLFFKKNGVEVLGKSLRPFKNIYINESLPHDVQVVTKLVAIAPKRIFVHDAKSTDRALINNIQNLFGGCVVIS